MLSFLTLSEQVVYYHETDYCIILSYHLQLLAEVLQNIYLFICLFIHLFIFNICIENGRFSIYTYIYKLYKNYCFSNESCRKEKKQATKLHISTANFMQKLLEILDRN